MLNIVNLLIHCMYIQYLILVKIQGIYGILSGETFFFLFFFFVCINLRKQLITHDTGTDIAPVV